LCQLYAAGRIQLRLYDAIYGPSADADRLLSEGPAHEHCGDKLAVRGIKVYIDGAFGSRGAALLQPYSDSPASRGLLVNTPEALFPLLTVVPVSQRAVAEPCWRSEYAQ
jgi:predicted amidohydrolase YtcJ